MDVRITNKNGESFTLEEYGITVKDFIVSSIEILTDYGTVDGRHGTVDRGSIYGSRTITVPFIMHSRDLHDFPLKRDKIFDLVLSTRSFYIQEMRRANYLSYDFVQPGEGAKQSEGTKNKLIGGKRYLVRLQNVFEIEQMILDGQGEFIFETTDLPYAESIGTTKTIDQDGLSTIQELWGFGMGLEYANETHKYTHSDSKFEIFNASNVIVHPFFQYLRIEITDFEEVEGAFRLVNVTNNSEFAFLGGLRRSDEIVIDGARVRYNNSEAFRRTRRTYIQLSPGVNKFEIEGAKQAKVSFDFRFYYK